MAWDTAEHCSTTGNEISAQAIMTRIAPQGVNSAQLLATANMTGICHSLKLDHALFVVLEAEKRAAMAAGPRRQHYFFVDFTSE